jgi:hypothetical protein
MTNSTRVTVSVLLLSSGVLSAAKVLKVADVLWQGTLIVQV